MYLGPLAWPDDDNRIYHAIALGLLEGGDIPLRWPPLLPLMDAGLMSVVGPSVLVPKLIVLAFGCLIPPLIALLAAEWGGRMAGLLAGLVAALHGFLVVSACSAMTEPPHAALVAAALVLVSRSAKHADDPARRLLLGAGITLGVATLVRPTGLVLILAIGMALLILRQQRRPWSRPLLLLAGAALVLLPWAASNRARHGAWKVTTTATGSTLLGGNCRAVLELGEGWLPRERCGVLTDDELTALSSAGEIEEDRILTAAALRDLSSDPGRWLPLALHKLQGILSIPEALRAPSLAARASGWGFLALLPFTLAGAVRSLRGRCLGAVAGLACVAATLALSLAFWGSSRLRQPVEPVLVAFAGVGLARALEAIPSRRPRARAGHVLRAG